MSGTDQALGDRALNDKSLWLLKLNENISLRRGQMFRMLQAMSQILLVGNAGGTALMFSVGPGLQQEGISHWLVVTGIVVFGIGALAAAVVMALLAGVVVREAHTSEIALQGYIKGELSREQTVRLIDPSAFPWAQSAAR